MHKTRCIFLSSRLIRTHCLWSDINMMTRRKLAAVFTCIKSKVAEVMRMSCLFCHVVLQKSAVREQLRCYESRWLHSLWSATAVIQSTTLNPSHTPLLTSMYDAAFTFSAVNCCLELYKGVLRYLDIVCYIGPFIVTNIRPNLNYLITGIYVLISH